MKGSNYCPYPDRPHKLKIGKTQLSLFHAYSKGRADATSRTALRQHQQPAPWAFAVIHANCRQPALGSFLGSEVRWPWALRQLQPASFLCPRHPQGHPRCTYRHAHARGNEYGTQLPVLPRRCVFHVIPTGLRHAYSTRALVSREASKLPWLVFLGIGGLFEHHSTAGSSARIMQPIGGAVRTPPSHNRALKTCVLKNFISYGISALFT